MLAVTTFFWSDPHRRRDYTFEHEHIRILRNMVDRHLSVPHKFICVSDDEIDDIQTVPLDWTKHVDGTCFIRLMQRRPDYGELIEADRVFNLDLDVVIVGNLDDIVSRTEESVWWRNPNFPSPGRAPYQTSIQLFTPGSHSDLWSRFDPLETPKWVNRRWGGAEQAWVSEYLPNTCLPAPHLGNYDGVWDHRDGIHGAGRLGGVGVQTELPKNAKIISFPGNRMMDQEEVQERHPWIKDHWK